MSAVPVLHANQKPCVTRVGSMLALASQVSWTIAEWSSQHPSLKKTAGGKLLIVACKVNAEHEAMHVVRSIELYFETTDEARVEEGRRSLVEDPIPDPEPAAPSLGHPDLGVFHHSPHPPTDPPFRNSD